MGQINCSTSETAIFIVGPSSTGKSTLCAAVADTLSLAPELYISETARAVMRTTGFTRIDVGKLEMQRAIMLAQCQSEQSARTFSRRKGLWTKKNGRVILSDRSAVDAIVYAGLTAADPGQATERKRSLMETTEFQGSLSLYRRSHVFLLSPVEEWVVDDGVRSLDNHTECFQEFRKTLQELGVEFTEIGEGVKLLADRVTVVLDKSGLRLVK